MLKKRLWRFCSVIGITMVITSGCSTDRMNADITMENSKLDTLSFDELSQKISDKNDFILMVTQENSTDSDLMRRTLVAYFRERDVVPIYELKLNEQGDRVEDASQAYLKFQDIVPHFSGSVPQCFYYKDGKVEKTINGAVSEISWQNFMIECGLIDGDVIEDTKITYTITEENLKKASLNDVASILRNSKSAYVYYAKEDRYNEAFSKKLSEIAKEQNITILLLKEKDIVLPDDEEESVKAQEDISLLNLEMNLNFSPCLYYLDEGISKSILKDNVDREEIVSWLAKHPLSN